MSKMRMIIIGSCTAVLLVAGTSVGVWRAAKRKAAAETLPPVGQTDTSPDSEGTTPGMEQLIPQTATAEEKVALALAVLAKTNPSSTVLRQGIIMCSEKDPKQTAEWVVRNIQRRGDRAFAIRTALGKWAEHDRQAALDFALTLSHGQGRECALNTVLRVWSADRPEEAAALLDGIDDFDTKSVAIGTIAVNWATKDINAVTKWALALPQGAGRLYALTAITYQLAIRDSSLAVTWLEELPDGRSRDATIRGIASLVAYGDAQSAEKWLKTTIPGGTKPDPAFQIRIAAWARTSPEEAVEWARQLGDESWTAHLLSTMAQSLAKTSPEDAATIAALIPAGTSRTHTIRKVAARWAAESPADAQAWAEQLDSGTDQDAAIAAVAKTTTEPEEDDAPEVTEEPADEEPEPEPDYGNMPWWELVPLVEQLPDGRMRDGLAHKTAVDWAKQDPEAAAMWAVEQMTPGRPADTTLKIIIWEWVQNDKDAVLAWTAGRTDEYTRDRALSSAAMGLVRTKPEEAASIAASMPDSPTRSNVVRNISYIWNQMNPAAANEWLTELDQ